MHSTNIPAFDPGLRRLLVGLAAASAGVPVLAESESEVMRLFREWKAACDACDAASEAEYDAAYAAYRDAEDAIVAARSQSMTDLALKIIVANGDEEMCIAITQRELVAEAYRIAGVDGWTEENEVDLREWREMVARNIAREAAA